MAILNFGSLNIDKVYTVAAIARPGETVQSIAYNIYPGGKGLNQSIAAAFAGAKVYHAGKIGEDGSVLMAALAQAGVDVSYLLTSTGPSGHAVIQVAKNGQNSIVLHGGANWEVTLEEVDEILLQFGPGTTLLLQNEISCLPYILESAKEQGMPVALNPSPISEQLLATDLSSVGLFILNEIEGEALTGQSQPKAICKALCAKAPGCEVVLTLGGQGAVYYTEREKEVYIEQKAFQVNATDTTAAGDTFTGYYLAAVTAGKTPAEGLELAAKAAAISVTRAGAAASIPALTEVEAAVL